MNKVAMISSGLALMLSSSVMASVHGQPGSYAHSEEDVSKLPLEKVAPYPEAKEGMTRNVIYLPKKDDEDNYKVELLIGKTMAVDCNNVSIGGKLKTETLKGWGYDYQVIDKLSEPASTMMGCPDNSKTSKFISAYLGNDAFIRYNSKLPIVVYAPKDVTVKYRVWAANKIEEVAQQK